MNSDISLSSLFWSSCNNNKGFVSSYNIWLITLLLLVSIGLVFLGRYLWPGLSIWWILLITYGVCLLFFGILMGIILLRGDK